MSKKAKVARQAHELVLLFDEMKEMVRASNAAFCEYEGCFRHREVREFCEMHYARLKRAGVSFKGKPFIKPAQTHVFLVDLLQNPAPDGCVSWPFSSTGGYGHFKFKDRQVRVHKLVCVIANGEPTTDAHVAAHDCGNSLCCNPTHLSWKTQKENIADKKTHGTQLRGETHKSAKLTEADVHFIRSMRGKETRKTLAERFSVSLATIDGVLDGTTWRHV